MWGFNRSPVHQQSFGNSANPNYSWNRAQSFGGGGGGAGGGGSGTNNASSNHSNNNSFSSPYKTYTKDEIVTDEHGLQKYLR